MTRVVAILLTLWSADRLSADELFVSRPLSPAEALGAMRPRAGFTVELVAAEPLVMDPVAFDWGADGRLWVCEMGDYPLGVDGRGTFGGRVRCLEDTDGDGRYDRSTVFLDGLGFPTGVMAWSGGVLVSCAPEIFYAEDADGDGRADVRRTLFTGFGEGNQQHRVNGFRWGLDGWVHGANGDSGGKIVSRITGQQVDIGGRDFRFRPDTGEIDPQTGQTQFGRDGDDWGHWFGSKNSNPLLHYVLPDEYLRRNPHASARQTTVEVPRVPGAAPVFPASKTAARFNDLNRANRFTSACGGCIYRDELFGAEFADNAFICEPVHNLVHREVLRRRGAIYTGDRAADEQNSEFLASTDNWFRPVMVRTGPDGALWVADMYRLVIEHPQWIPPAWQARLDLRAGHDRGRIYRVLPGGVAPRAVPRLDRATTTERAAALESPSGVVRDHAQQLLTGQKDRAAAPLVRRLVETSPRPQTRLQALCTLVKLDAAVAAEVLDRALSDEHPQVRRHAVRLCESFLNRSPALADHVKKLSDDVDAEVRVQVACSLGEAHALSNPDTLARMLLRDHADPILLAAVLSSLGTTPTGAGHLVPTLRAVCQEPDKTRPARIAALNALVSLAMRDASGAAAEVLWAEITQPHEGRFAVWQIDAAARALDAMRSQPAAASMPQQAGSAAPLRPERLDALVTYARQQAADDTAAEGERVAALRLLGRNVAFRDADRRLLAGLLAPPHSVALRSAAIAALGRIADAPAYATLCQAWPALGRDARSQVLDLLLAREPGRAALIEALEHHAIPTTDLDTAHVQRLVDLKDARLGERARKLFGGGWNADRARVVAQFSDCLTTPGSVERGRDVFKRRCAQCHRLEHVGFAVGPDLAALTDRSPATLLTAILDPNRAVEAKFLTYTAVTVDGLTHVGLLAAESGASLTLLAAEGKQVTLLRSELDVLAGNRKSLMPEGMEKELTRQDLADLFALLGQNRSRPKTLPGNTPDVVRAESLRGEFYLLPRQAEIYGPSLVFEPRYSNLGQWYSGDDVAQWSVEVEKAGHYEVSLDYACDEGSAGNEFAVVAGGLRLAGRATSTGNWDTYRTVAVGRIELVVGRQTVVVRSQGNPRGPLFDLGSIRLRPTK